MIAGPGGRKDLDLGATESVLRLQGSVDDKGWWPHGA